VPNLAFNGLSDDGVGRRLIEGRLNYNDRLRAFHESLAPHYHVARKLSLSEQIDYISNKIDYAGWWDKSEANDALFDLSIYTSTLSTLAKDFNTLPKLWKHIKEMKRAMKEKNSENGLRFSTIHGSKGLEFPVVAVIGVSNRLYPFYRAVEENGKEGYDEEARLFYVASTRAIKELYYFEINGKHGRTNVVPSPFIQLTNRVLKHEYPKEPME
jgi:DNA helicase-2/ATP-dependent DNA helicase PcrA